MPSTFSTGDSKKTLPTAISHALRKWVIATENYLEAASRLRELEPAAVSASRCAEILQKALAQVHEAGRASRELRGALTDESGSEYPTALRPAHKGFNPAYRVHFLNEFARNGSVIRACQRSITIRSARNRERAVEAAKKRFARIERIPDWRIHARIVEVEVIETAIDGR